MVSLRSSQPRYVAQVPMLGAPFSFIFVIGGIVLWDSCQVRQRCSFLRQAGFSFGESRSAMGSAAVPSLPGVALALPPGDKAAAFPSGCSVSQESRRPGSAQVRACRSLAARSSEHFQRQRNSYGHEIARLSEAQTLVKRGYDAARRGGVAQPVQQDIKVPL